MKKDQDNSHINVVIPGLHEVHNLHACQPSMPASVDTTILVDGHFTNGPASPLKIPLFVGVLFAGNEFARGSRFIKGRGQ
jgi:hypothetical protein